jgi:hypothetical protein
MWTLRKLIEYSDATQAEINGKWVPARSIPEYGLYGLKIRLKDAWSVL